MKYKNFLLRLFLVVLLLPVVVYGKGNKLSLNKEKIHKGSFSVEKPKKENLFILIEKDNRQSFYPLNNKPYSLYFGNGDYKITLLENVINNKYKVIERKNLKVNLMDPKLVFTNPSQNSYWKEEMPLVHAARDLTKNLHTNEEKIKAIHNYIIQNIKYDHEKIIPSSEIYTPSPHETFISKKGICYDYSSLFASMTRSVNIPTKIISGYKNDIENYHAWNLVYLNEKEGWKLIDTTYDSTFLQNGIKLPLFKDQTEYTHINIY